jgi:hypothetical protein
MWCSAIQRRYGWRESEWVRERGTLREHTDIQNNFSETSGTEICWSDWTERPEYFCSSLFFSSSFLQGVDWSLTLDCSKLIHSTRVHSEARDKREFQVLSSSPRNCELKYQAGSLVPTVLNGKFHADEIFWSLLQLCLWCHNATQPGLLFFIWIPERVFGAPLHRCLHISNHQ